MSEEMKFKNDYQDTFNEVHAPVALSGKVMNMSKAEKKRTAVSIAKKGAAAAAIALALLAGGNGVVYAATGSNLLKTVMVYINGSGYEVDLEERVDENGDVTYYEATFDVEDESGSVVITDEMEVIEEPYGVAVDTPEVIEKEGKLYLVDGTIELDITEDLEDGEAAGSYEKDGLLTEYKVSGENGVWEVSIK